VGRVYRSRAKAKADVFDYIEQPTIRVINFTLGHVSPVAYEKEE